jgi:hypothetical protein
LTQYEQRPRIITDKERRKRSKTETGKTSRAILRDAVGEFEKITHAISKLEIRMRDLSARKLLEALLERNPDPQAIYSFFRVTEELHQAWLALLEKGKAPTRQAIGRASAKSIMAQSGTEKKPLKNSRSQKK